MLGHRIQLNNKLSFGVYLPLGCDFALTLLDCQQMFKQLRLDLNN